MCSAESQFFHEDKRRHYYRCANCQLVSVPDNFHLTLVDEKKEYDKHNNSPLDSGYRNFLGRLVHPLLKTLKSGSNGLDFGCGPGPTLSVMFAEEGMNMELFDPFYYPSPEVLSKKYDFVTATEVVEHLRMPDEVLANIWACIKPGGSLGLMTKLVQDEAAFSNWHYKNDPTHIQFFSLDTLKYIEQTWQAQLTQCADDAFIFVKPNQ